jgi:hypothetical protein
LRCGDWQGSRSARWARGRLPRTTRGARPDRIAHGRCSEPLAYWCVASSCARPRPASSRAAAPSQHPGAVEPTDGPRVALVDAGGGRRNRAARGLRSRASPIPLRTLTVRTGRGTRGQHNSIMRTRDDLGSQRPAESIPTARRRDGRSSTPRGCSAYPSCGARIASYGTHMTTFRL